MVETASEVMLVRTGSDYVQVVREAFRGCRELVQARTGCSVHMANALVASVMDLRNCAIYGLGHGYFEDRPDEPSRDLSVVGVLPKDVFLWSCQPAPARGGLVRASPQPDIARWPGRLSDDLLHTGQAHPCPQQTEEGAMPRIETRRLTLRPFADDDWHDFQELGTDWKAAPGPEFDKWPTSEEACKASVAHMATQDKYLAMCLRSSGKVVGLLGLNGTDEQGRMDVGHVVLSKHQDDDLDREALQAIVQRAFDAQDVVAVVTHNAADHAAQLAPLRSLGLTNSDPSEAGELSISRDEWERRHPGGKAA